MSHFFENIKIENFKSLRHIELTDCKRINLFIGKPNVGKSNILEALSVFGAFENPNTINKEALRENVRYKHEADLAFDGDIENNSRFISNISDFELSFDLRNGMKLTGDVTKKNGQALDSKIKKYSFNFKEKELKSRGQGDSLWHPHGENLLDILLQKSKLLGDCQTLFNDYRLQLFYDKNERTLKIAKHTGKIGGVLPVIFSVDYGMIADTLQRIIFYKAAINSNKDTILLFEEPEAHSFPPYIVHITQEIIHSKENQFFLTTHSPFVLNDFLENAREDLAVYLVDWQSNETAIKRLSDTELHQIYQYGVDLFTNIETFI
jgi:AAA15 family ATPase/GTPase